MLHPPSTITMPTTMSKRKYRITTRFCNKVVNQSFVNLHESKISTTVPMNKGKGGKTRRRGKNENDDMKRELIFREDGQEHAQVKKMLRNGRLEAICFDGTKRLCHIRGKMRKKVWVGQGDIILVGLRDYQDAKADVILKYMSHEARNSKSYGEFPETVKINETDTFGEEAQDDDFEFDDQNNPRESSLWKT